MNISNKRNVNNNEQLLKQITASLSQFEKTYVKDSSLDKDLVHFINANVVNYPKDDNPILYDFTNLISNQYASNKVNRGKIS